MPWKETCPMKQREEFVREVLSSRMPFRELCRRFEISPKTGYKWVHRYHEGGAPALHDQSTRPVRSPSGLPEDVVCRIIELKLAHSRWGPRKLWSIHAEKYGAARTPSVSSFKRVLDKAGLVEKVARRRAPARGGRLQSRRRATACNEVWTVDFKGWWYTTDSRRCEPLTVRDAHSRFILCVDPLENARTETVQARFARIFADYGLPETIRSDNGTPFSCSSALLGLSELSAWWLALGISLDRIDPGRPDQNGSHERMHRDIAWEIQGRVQGDLEAQRAALTAWRESYNRERPHEALEYKVPASVYTSSSAPYRGTPEEIAYPEGYTERRVNRNGLIRWEGTQIFLTTALRGWNVGLIGEDEDSVGVWFAGLRLGTINPRTSGFAAARPAVEMPPCGEPVET